MVIIKTHLSRKPLRRDSLCHPYPKHGNLRNAKSLRCLKKFRKILCCMELYQPSYFTLHLIFGSFANTSTFLMICNTKCLADNITINNKYTKEPVLTPIYFKHIYFISPYFFLTFEKITLFEFIILIISSVSLNPSCTINNETNIST